MPGPTTALAPLVVTGLSVTYPDRTVLTGVDLLAQPGRRIGLVGENGVGKSTLLRAVAGRLPDARGSPGPSRRRPTSCCSARSRPSATAPRSPRSSR